MENIIYNELQSRGFKVDVGGVSFCDNNVKKNIEIDFVANLLNKRYYIQSCLNLSDKDKQFQEKRPLLSIKDGFPKIIIVKDNIPTHVTQEGILIIDLADFLLNPDILP